MLKSLGWESLQQQRAYSRVLMLYHIQNGLVQQQPYSSNDLSTASTNLHQRSRNTIHADAVQFQYVQTDFRFMCDLDVEFSAH